MLWWLLPYSSKKQLQAYTGPLPLEFPFHFLPTLPPLGHHRVMALCSPHHTLIHWLSISHAVICMKLETIWMPFTVERIKDGVFIQRIWHSDETELFVMTHNSMDVLHKHNISRRKPGAGNTPYVSTYVMLKIRQSYSCVRGEDDGSSWSDNDWMDSRGVLISLFIWLSRFCMSVCRCVWNSHFSLCILFFKVFWKLV